MGTVGTTELATGGLNLGQAPESLTKEALFITRKITTSPAF